MTGERLSDTQTARRHGMTLVRLRDGVFPSGQPVPANHPSRDHERPVHIVQQGPDSINVEPVTSCCGLVFEPGTVEIVAWGTELPHEVCVRKTGYPPSFVSRMDREEQDTTLRLNASDEDMAISITSLDKVLATRGRDWLQADEGNVWTYEDSFNGVFYRDRLYLRGRDFGLQRLTVEIPYPGAVHIHACGVRDGCPRHLVRTETFPLDDMKAVDKRIESHEFAATSISLMELAWCLVTGDCSAVRGVPRDRPGPLAKCSVDVMTKAEPASRQAEIIGKLEEVNRAVAEHSRRVLAGEVTDWASIAGQLTAVARLCRMQVRTELADIGDSGSR